MVIVPVMQASARSFHPGADTAAGRCSENHPFILFANPSGRSRSALCGANFSGCFHSVALRRPLSRLARSMLTHRLPTALSSHSFVSVPGEEEFAVISQYFKSRYRDFAPRPFGPRYQTAGSIGALARDEPVTPGVTFLSPPAPNSGDLEDR